MAWLLVVEFVPEAVDTVSRGDISGAPAENLCAEVFSESGLFFLRNGFLDIVFVNAPKWLDTWVVGLEATNFRLFTICMSSFIPSAPLALDRSRIAASPGARCLPFAPLLESSILESSRILQGGGSRKSINCSSAARVCPRKKGSDGLHRLWPVEGFVPTCPLR
jgi:hypothetical protein